MITMDLRPHVVLTRLLRAIGIHRDEEDWEEVDQEPEEDPDAMPGDPHGDRITEYERGWLACERNQVNESGAPILKGRRLAEAIHGRTVLIQTIKIVKDDHRRRKLEMDPDVRLCLIAAESWIRETNGQDGSVTDFVQQRII